MARRMGSPKAPKLLLLVGLWAPLSVDFDPSPIPLFSSVWGTGCYLCFCKIGPPWGSTGEPGLVVVPNMHPLHVYVQALPCPSAATWCYYRDLGHGPCLCMGEGGGELPVGG